MREELSSFIVMALWQENVFKLHALRVDNVLVSYFKSESQILSMCYLKKSEKLQKSV